MWRMNRMVRSATLVAVTVVGASACGAGDSQRSDATPAAGAASRPATTQAGTADACKLLKAFLSLSLNGKADTARLEAAAVSLARNVLGRL